VGYFGKIPSRGDFVKAADNIPLITVLDEWLAETMSLLVTDPRWKIDYDSLPPLHFAFIGPRKKRAIAGHIVSSADSSQRRFPFMSMGVFDMEQSGNFVGNSPLILCQLWQQLAIISEEIVRSSEPTDILNKLSNTLIAIEVHSEEQTESFDCFLEKQTVGSLQALLGDAQLQGSIRQLILALGLLLQPVMSSGSDRLEKSLVLPLPSDQKNRYLVGAFWMHLISPFLERADFELALFFTEIQKQPSLILGFSGASANTLEAIFASQNREKQHIRFLENDWVEEQIHSDYGLKKLSSYLAQDKLSLKSVFDSFSITFTGV
ncbi:MAG: type VI secretion system-associated protein TagF, partial [Burkholderiales bacterium]|nr:type VI secretion system-associated protein TagF [Burkholderiales bacterium]